MKLPSANKLQMCWYSYLNKINSGGGGLVVSDSCIPRVGQPTRLLCPWDFPNKNTEVGCHFLLQGIFPTQGSNLGLLHCGQILYQLSHLGSPGVLK